MAPQKGIKGEGNAEEEVVADEEAVGAASNECCAMNDAWP